MKQDHQRGRQAAKRVLLVIDDDRVFGEAVRGALTSDVLDVLLAHKASDGMALCALRKIDVIVLDQQLPDAEGHTLCQQILQYHDQTKIIFSTAYPSFDNAIRAIRTGAHDYLSKPYDLEELSLAVKQAVRTLELEQVEEVQDYQRTRERNAAVLIGSECMGEIQHLIGVAASTDSPVLITGETGTGKSLAAKAVHYSSASARAPFISVNCASLPDTLIESELFGHEKGAFTGAVGAKRGLIEMAEGGTIFLDEIGEIPVHLQAKLLSAIDEKVIRRLGGTTSKPVNVRIIAATSVDLEADGGARFRKDLYYRLSVIRMHMPRLRDRKKDIPALCAHLLKLITPHRVPIAEGEMELLEQYDWPGNIRELKNVLERSVLIQSGEELRPSLLLKRPIAEAETCSPTPAGERPIRTLAEHEREIILATFDRLSGNLTQTAKALGISLSTLKRKLHEYRNS